MIRDQVRITETPFGENVFVRVVECVSGNIVWTRCVPRNAATSTVVDALAYARIQNYEVVE